MPQLTSPNTIAITVPATTAFLRHLRVVTATVADDAGFDVEAIESLRVAVDELCALAIADAADGAELSANIEATTDGIVLEGTCGPVTDDPLVDPIAAQLLAAGASSHDLSRVGDECRFSLRADVRGR